MSDNFRVLGVGGAGINAVKALGYRNSIYLDSQSYDSLEGIKEFLTRTSRNEKVVVVSSPAGEFSSAVLETVCNALNSNGDSVFLIGIMPFHSESPERKRRGDAILRNLRKAVDSTAIVENENFASSMREYSWTQVLARINDHVADLVKGFVTLGGNQFSPTSHELVVTGRSSEYSPAVHTVSN